MDNKYSELVGAFKRSKKNSSGSLENNTTRNDIMHILECGVDGFTEQPVT
jgi:hypothetical protein